MTRGSPLFPVGAVAPSYHGPEDTLMHAASCSLHAGGGLELRRALEASSPQSPTASLNFFTASSCHLATASTVARIIFAMRDGRR